jgi:hypothetical protein
LLRRCQHPDRGFVLRGHDRAAVDELEARRGGIAVTRDDIEVALAGGAKEAELGRTGP